MSRPGSPSSGAAMAAAMSGAVDLAPLKQAAAQQQAGPPGREGGGPGPAGALSPVVDVSEATFESEVIARSSQVPVIVELVVGGSEPCAQLDAVLTRLAGEAGGRWVLARVDVDAQPRVAQMFGVQSVPTVVALAMGRVLADFQGVQPEEELRQWLSAVEDAVAGRLSGPPPAAGDEEPADDPRFTAAEAALDAGDLDGADRAYQEILDAEPGNTEAAAAQRQVRFLARAAGLGPDAIAKADAAPADVAAALDAADAELYAQQPEAAFARLIAVVRVTSGDDRSAARTRLLELFELFDPAEPFVVTARRRLAAALY